MSFVDAFYRSTEGRRQNNLQSKSKGNLFEKLDSKTAGLIHRRPRRASNSPDETIIDSAAGNALALMMDGNLHRSLVRTFKRCTLGAIVGKSAVNKDVAEAIRALVLHETNLKFENAVVKLRYSDCLEGKVDWNVLHPTQVELFDVGRKSFAGAKFRPSLALLQIVEDGYNERSKFLSTKAKSQLQEARRSQKAVYSDELVFLQTLEDVLSTIAFRVIDGIYAKTEITDDRRFNYLFQQALLDVYPVLPSEFEKFQSLLRRELVDYLSNDGEISGRWGQLIVSANELKYNLESDPRRGTELEGEWEFATPGD